MNIQINYENSTAFYICSPQLQTHVMEVRVEPRAAAVGLLRMGTATFPILALSSIVVGSSSTLQLRAQQVLASHAGMVLAFIGGMLQSLAVSEARGGRAEARLAGLVLVACGIALAIAGQAMVVVAWAVPERVATVLMAQGGLFAIDAMGEARLAAWLSPRGLDTVLLRPERRPCILCAVASLALAALGAMV
jgi:hypothetical protein